MIPVDRKVLDPEPVNFDAGCRQQGLAWLKANPRGVRKGKRVRDFWSPFRLELATRFSDLCAYGALYAPSGTVDHFRPIDADETQAYEWKNFRFAFGWINSSKSKCRAVLDPFLVKAGWFEIHLPSLQLIARKDRIPKKFHSIVDNTVRQLHLRDDERIVRPRRKWLQMYEEHRIDLHGLREVAPLIADAVVRENWPRKPGE